MRFRFFISITIIFLTVATNAQQHKKIEYFIKDTITLSQHHSKLEILLSSGNTPELAETYKRIADYYYMKWQADSLVLYYKKAMQQYERLKDSFHIYYCRYRIGETIAAGEKNPDEALVWHLPGAKYFERTNEYLMAAYANYEISMLYKTKGQDELKQKHISRAIELNKTAKDTLLYVIILSAQCNEWKEEKNWGGLLVDAKKMIVLSRKIPKPVFIKVGLIQISTALLELNRPAEALPYLEESISITNAGRKAVPESYRLLAICNLRIGRNAEAEKYMQLYKHTTDSIIKLEADDDYQKLLVQFETEKKEATIASLQTENLLKGKLSRSQKVFIILLIVILGLVLIAVWNFYRNSKRRRKLEAELQKQRDEYDKQIQREKEEKMTFDFNKQLAEVQLTALSAQMNPHFIFNCMNSIQKYILKNEKAKALEFLQNFSELMRSVLDNSTKTKVALDEEIGMLEKYIILEKQRLDDQFDYNIQIEPYLQADFFEIPGMVIQPYVENAIWHGLMNKNEKGNLLLKFEKQNGFLKCIIEDDGVGRAKAQEMEKDRSPKRKSYGMAIARKRLELLQKEHEKPPEIIIEDLYEQAKPKGTKVTIYMTIE